MIHALVILVVVSLILWLVQRYIPEPAKTIITVVAVVFLCLWLLSAFGLIDHMDFKTLR